MLHNKYAHEQHHQEHGACVECKQAMFTYGALLPVEIGPPKPLVDLLTKEGKPIPPTKTGYGLIDTGASVTTLHEPYITELGVNVVNAQELSTPSGGKESHNTYPVRIKFPTHNIDEELNEIITASLENFLTPEGEPIIGLIGRDLLSGCIFIYNGELGMYSLAT